jgi:uncharacterized repeat protein (TIGR01451 family)
MTRRTLLGGGLLVAFLLLAAMLLTIPAWADLITVTQTTLEDFNAGTLYHTGLTRFDDGEVQLLVVGLAGEWITDTNTTGLPALARHSAIYYNDHILVVGGWDIDRLPRDEVYYTTIDPYDHNLADWQTTTPLPSTTYPNGGLFWHASVVVHDRVYVLGGADTAPSTYATVSFAPINADGTLGGWQTTTPLPTALRLLSAVVVNDRIYVIGGWDASNAPHSEVYFATPNPATGLISGWTATTSFAHSTFGHMVSVHDSRIYVMGGYHPTLEHNVSPYTHYATPNPATGQLGPWTQTTDMEHNIYGGAGLSFSGVLYTTGGAINNLQTPSDYVGTTLIGLSGAVGSWQNTSLVDPGRFYHAAVRSDDGWLYVINGSDGQDPIRSINRGATSGIGEQYAPDGIFTSSTIDFGSVNRLRELQWNATISDTSIMTITLQYRTKRAAGDDWSAWFGPYPSSPTSGTVTTTVTLAGSARFVQYQAYLATAQDDKTPSLNAVHIIYETPTYALRVAKDAQPLPGTTLLPGDEISYTLTYSNSFEGITATHTIIEDELPQFTTYVPGSIYGPGANDSNPRLLRWNLGTVLPDNSGQVGFAVVVSPTLVHDTILENRATIDSDQGPLRFSNVVTHSVEVPYEIQLVQDAVPAPGSLIEPSSFITYMMRLTNTGAVPVYNVVLTDTYDLTEDYVVVSTDPAPDPGFDSVWSFGALDLGESREVQVVVQLQPILPDGWPVTNQAEVMSLQGPALESPIVTHTTYIPDSTPMVDLAIQGIRWQPSAVNANSPIDFYVTITNQGTLDADHVFWIELYIKPSPSSPPSMASDHDHGYCLNGCTILRPNFVEGITNLGTGAGFEVPFRGTDLLFPTEGLYDVYAQIDVAFDGDGYNPFWGSFPERDETNNMGHETVAVGDGLFHMYCPAIYKNGP